MSPSILARAAALCRPLPWILGSTCLLWTACSGSPSASAPSAAPDPVAIHRGDRIEIPQGSPLRTRLVVNAAAHQSLRRSLEAPAEVEADPARMARITSPLPGRVVQIFVRLGDSVQQNQPLLTLDSPELVAAQTDYLRAHSALSQAERTLSRQDDLRKHGIGSARELDQAQTERDLARSEMERAGLRLKLLGIETGALGRPLSVRSPISGRVVDYKVAPGEYRTDLSLPLLTIADLSTVWVTAAVPEKDIRRVQAGEDATASFAAYPELEWHGKVLHVGDLIKPETRTISVRVAFENADRRLRPGMFGTVRFTESAAKELVVPTRAIVLIGDASYVFVEVEPWVFSRRRIKPGAQFEKLTAVAEGLRAGERIVTENAVLLQ